MEHPRILRAEDFPRLREEDNAKQQIRTLYDYVFKLREQLQYLLHNLTEDNWNEAALKQFVEKLLSELGSGNEEESA